MTRTQTGYTYTSNPHAAPRALFSQSVPLTMMSDPRVVRGNTHTLAKKAAVQRAQESEKDALIKAKVEAKRVQEQLARTNMHPDPTGPYYRFEVKPFSSLDFDIAQYLEAPDDLGPRMRDVQTEVDQLNERPATPEYIPRKTGIDRQTQVEDVTELFDFDIEVQPMLEVIVQKTMEQALLEVNAEEEIQVIQEKVSHYQAEKEKEMTWMKEQMDKIKEEEEELEIQRRRILRAKQRERDVRITIAGVNMMQQIVPDMIDKISNEQVKKGAWKSSDRQHFERQLWPATLRAADQTRDALYAAQQVLDGKQNKLYMPCHRCICVGPCFNENICVGRSLVLGGGVVCEEDPFRRRALSPPLPLSRR